MITWLLFFALFYLLVTSVIFLRNRIELTVPVAFSRPGKVLPKISVCIPARNEEKNIALVLESLLVQDYPEFEILVLDDHSEDSTVEIVTNLRYHHPELITLLRGTEKPADWLGKPWACHQLGQQCNGDILLFIDADTRLETDALSAVAGSFKKYDLDMFTAWPGQVLGTFWEKTVIPLIYYALVTMLPAIYVFRDPRWMPARLKEYFSSAFVAANGQCIAFTRQAYKQIGGHESVKNQVVEDVELAKVMKKHNGRIRMFNGLGILSCRMYRNNRELFAGLRKNFLAGFGYSIPLFITAMILHLVVFILPFVAIILSLILLDTTLFFLSVACIGIILLHRLILATWFGWNPIYAFTHPAGVLWFQWLGVLKLMDHYTGRKSEWKGRKV